MLGWDAIGAIAGVLAVIGMLLGGVHKFWSSRRRLIEVDKANHIFEEKGVEWIFERKLTYTDLLKRLIAIDVASIAHMDFNDPAEGTAAQWAPVFEYSNDTWKLIVYNGMTIAAYWQAVSLNDSAVRRLKNGTLKDSRIKLNDIRKINEPGQHSIYMIYIGKHPDFENNFGIRLFKELMKSLSGFHEQLIRDGVDVVEILANGQTDEGIMLCKHLNMKIIGEVQGGPLFQAPFAEVNWRMIEKYQS